jgi:dienelactone hydrolase
MRLTLLLAALLLAAAWSGTPVEIPPQSIPGTRESPRNLPAKLTLPAGSEPHPAIILLHGCAGLRAASQGADLMDQWTERLTGWGYAVLIPDSFTPRGIPGVCAKEDQPKVTTTDRSGDAVSAAIFLTRVAGIDPKRIGVIGFSHGGGTAERVTLLPAAGFRPGLIRAAVDYYGTCARPHFYRDVPLLALAGDADTWGYPARSCAEFGRAIGPGRPFEAVVYPGAVNGFDNRNLQRRVTSNGHPLQYDEAAAEDSFARVRDFLARYLR